MHLLRLLPGELPRGRHCREPERGVRDGDEGGVTVQQGEAAGERGQVGAGVGGRGKGGCAVSVKMD